MPELSDFHKDQPVYVWAFGQWRPATVLAVLRTRVRIDYRSRADGTETKQRDVYPAELVPALGLTAIPANTVAVGAVLRDGRRVVESSHVRVAYKSRPIRLLRFDDGSASQYTSLLVRTPIRARAAKAGLCEWYAGCQNRAELYVLHATLGTVPVCQRCAERHALRGDPIDRDNDTPAFFKPSFKMGT